VDDLVSYGELHMVFNAVIMMIITVEEMMMVGVDAIFASCKTVTRM